MILERIRQIYPELTKSQRKLADFVANSYQEAAFMTASRLAKRLNVNEATVIRFAQRLGYQGYPELIHDVQALVQEELQAPAEAGAPTLAEEPFLVELKNEVESLQRAVSHVSTETAHQLLAVLRGTSRIYVAGQGASYHLAGLLAAGLSGLGLDARAVAGTTPDLAPALASLQPADALVGIAVGQESPEIARAMRAARERGARTLAVTSSPISGLAQAADLALSCPAGDLFPAPSPATVAAFLDALVQALALSGAASGQQFRRASDKALRAGG